MAKNVYGIPADLNATYADMEIAIQSKDGVGAKPLPIKVILTYVGSIMLCFYICSQTIVKYGELWQIVLFVVLWIALTLVLAKYDGTKRMQIQLIPTLLNYIPKANRYIITRTSSSANAFYRIAGIKNIDETSGLVSWEDGTYGYWYRVVGSASVLLFDEDRNAILNRVDMFYRKMNTDAECVFLTAKESQKVYRQIANLKRRYDALNVDDAELKACAEEQFTILKHYVGGSFKSIHQYLVIKADNKEALIQTKNVVQSEVENSTLMIKQCIPMYKEDIDSVLHTIYSGKV